MKKITAKVITISSQILVVSIFLVLLFSIKIESPWPTLINVIEFLFVNLTGIACIDIRSTKKQIANLEKEYIFFSI